MPATANVIEARYASTTGCRSRIFCTNDVTSKSSTASVNTSGNTGATFGPLIRSAGV